MSYGVLVTDPDGSYRVLAARTRGGARATYLDELVKYGGCYRLYQYCCRFTGVAARLITHEGGRHYIETRDDGWSPGFTSVIRAKNWMLTYLVRAAETRVEKAEGRHEYLRRLHGQGVVAVTTLGNRSPLLRSFKEASAWATAHGDELGSIEVARPRLTAAQQKAQDEAAQEADRLSGTLLGGNMAFVDSGHMWDGFACRLIVGAEDAAERYGALREGPEPVQFGDGGNEFRVPVVEAGDQPNFV